MTTAVQPCIEMLRAGRHTSVQDLGRRGWRHLGISLSGALDPLALQTANLLVGNAPAAAGLEITLCPALIRFHGNGYFALAGAAVGAYLDGKPVSPWWRQAVLAGQTLELTPPQQGMRCYLAVSGGIAVPMVLGSRSTDLKAGFGGLDGRTLKDGDRLPLGAPTPAVANERPVGLMPPAWRPLLRVLPGPEYGWFDQQAQGALWNSEWLLTPQSNRMGYRLAGPSLTRICGVELPSHGVLPGVIQVPPSGQPIVLLADAQTTGGYPKIGVVIAADLWKLAQLRLGARLRFVRCGQAEALDALRNLQNYLTQVEYALHER